MSQRTHAVITCTIGIDTGKNTLHLVGLDDRGTMFCVRSLAAGGLGPGLRIFRRA
jgi:transposase